MKKKISKEIELLDIGPAHGLSTLFLVCGLNKELTYPSIPLNLTVRLPNLPKKEWQIEGAC